MAVAVWDYLVKASPEPPAVTVVVAGGIHMVLVTSGTVVITVGVVAHIVARAAQALARVVD
jgi:hypothetical protein